MKKILVFIVLFCMSHVSYADQSQWQPITNLDDMNGIVIRLHQELEALKNVAREAEKFDGIGQTNFEHEDFIKALEILQKELEDALKTGRLKSE